jgi:UDP-glucose 4-epimerase
MRIAVFGATGSIGVHTSLFLKSKGHEVIALGHRNSDNGFFLTQGIEYYSVDIKEKSSFSIVPGYFDAVIHFAGAMPARMKGYDPYEYINSIIKGTLNVLEFMVERNCNKIVFSQSISDVLYRFGTTEPIEDDALRRFPLNSDHSVYSISKNTAVNLIEHYHAKFGIQRFILRLPTIYVYHPNPYYYVDGIRRWMGYRYIIDQAIKGHTLEIWGDPKSIKEMVYVKDFMQLVWKSVESSLDGGVYNVGCGRPISIEDQIHIIADVFSTGKKSDIIYKPNNISSPQFVLDISKAVKDLGYAPVYGFRDMMVDFKKEMELEPFSKLWGEAKDYLKD